MSDWLCCLACREDRQLYKPSIDGTNTGASSSEASEAILGFKVCNLHTLIFAVLIVIYSCLCNSATGLTRCGILYKPGSIVRIPPRSHETCFNFTFALIEQIIVVDDVKFFVLRYLDILCFNDHFYSYEVQRASQTVVLPCCSIVQHDTLCLRKKADLLLVNEKLPVVINVPGL